MTSAQFWFDAICGSIFLGGCIVIYCMVTAPWPVMP
jgi:hypothetical protein